jgi:uncharacterized secreted protein with C-terminal beta-propeller domain
MKTNKIVMFLTLALFALVAGCSNQVIDNGGIDVPKTTEFESQGRTLLEKDTLKKISSRDELQELYLKNSNSFGNQNYYLGDFAFESSGRELSAFDDSASSKVVNSGSGATDFSTTNNQIMGVDEADIVKNDGSYIYTLSQNRIVIVQAFPAEISKVVSEIEMDENDNIQEFFISNNELIVFVNSYSESLRVSQDTLTPYPHYEDQTKVLIYSIKSREEPTLIKSYALTGSYHDSRMIGDQVYFISQEYMNSYSGPIFPILYKDGLRITEPDIFYFNFKADSSYYSIGSLDLNNLDSYNVESYLLETGASLFMSENNMYISYRKQFDQDYVEQFSENVLPLIENSQKGIFEKHITKKDKDGIAITLEEYLHTLDEDPLEDFMKKYQRNLEEYNDKIQAETRKTVIHKLSLGDDGLLYYETKGEIEGHLLNQFSLDEKDGNLRVATTTSFWIRGEGSTSYNNVFVLDDNLEQIGSIEKLAEDERIYSTRFLGDRLYMVTFKQVDPLFVIDLSEPEQPRVLGELKIPGFSSYLHPYGDNFLIGVGKETKENEWGGFETIGLKLSLFDVSDVTNPKEVDKYIFEGKWSDSEVLYDHKAFLFDPSKRLLVLPVREGRGNEDDYYPTSWFRGAYAFEITGDGFELLDTISHFEGKEDEQNYYWNNPNVVKRSLWMDNILYTVSEGKIIASDLDNKLEEISSVDLGYDTKADYYYPYYY